MEKRLHFWGEHIIEKRLYYPERKENGMMEWGLYHFGRGANTEEARSFWGVRNGGEESLLFYGWGK